MEIKRFISIFNFYFPSNEIHSISVHLEDKFTRSFFDPCFFIDGMISIKKQKLLNIAFSCLEMNECYLEIGTYTGKSLISAMINNNEHKVYACDNFSEFNNTNSIEILMRNLDFYGLKDKVTFYNADFRNILNREKIEFPIGAYFYDGAHDLDSQYMGIKSVEHLLSDEALVIVDDWRFAQDSQSFAKLGTENAIKESKHLWQMLYELPSRYNGDHAMWWNGIAVYSFKRMRR
jgi:predicted O-methyltransferase YrrM